MVYLQTIPHVHECNFCEKCIVGDSPDGASASQRSLLATSADGPRARSSAPGDAHHIRASRAALREMVHKLRSEFLDTSDTHHARRLHRELKVDSELRASYLSRTLVPEDFSPSKKDILRKQTLPNCTECYGCNTHLEYMHKETEFMGHTFTNERGATSSWIFRASTPKARGGHALVKVYCVPVSKTGNKVAKCGPQYVMNVFQVSTPSGWLPGGRRHRCGPCTGMLAQWQLRQARCRRKQRWQPILSVTWYPSANHNHACVPAPRQPSVAIVTALPCSTLHPAPQHCACTTSNAPPPQPPHSPHTPHHPADLPSSGEAGGRVRL